MWRYQVMGRYQGRQALRDLGLAGHGQCRRAFAGRHQRRV